MTFLHVLYILRLTDKGGEFGMAEKTISFKVEESLHREIKSRADQQGLALKDYIIKLIERDIFPFRER